MEHTNMNKKFWKALACGIVIGTFTGAVGMAQDVEVKPVGAFTKEIGSVKAVDTQGVDGKRVLLHKEGTTPEKTGLYIRHKPGHFRVSMYGAVKDVHWIDKVVSTDSGHMVGVLLDFDENTTMMITRRGNKPTPGISQERWNTTWYDHPIQGMTDEEYMAIWRREDPHMSEKYTQLEGGLLWREEMTAARWDRSVQMTSDGPKVRFTVDMIMKEDPTHRYVITFTYDDIQKHSIESLKHLVDILEYLPEDNDTDTYQKETQQSQEQGHAIQGKKEYNLPSTLIPDESMETKDVIDLEDLYHQELNQGKISGRNKQELKVTEEGITSQSTWDDTSKTEAQIQRSGQIRLERK